MGQISDGLLAHRIMEVLIGELGLTKVISLSASVASARGDQAAQIDPEEVDPTDKAREWRTDAQALRAILTRLHH